MNSIGAPTCTPTALKNVCNTTAAVDAAMRLHADIIPAHHGKEGNENACISYDAEVTRGVAGVRDGLGNEKKDDGNGACYGAVIVSAFA